MIRSMTESEFDRVFAQMEESFPSDERRPYEEQKVLLSRPEYRIEVWEEDGCICGFAAVWEFSEFTFLEHLAVDAACRNRGIGGKLLSGLLSKSKKTLCLEVELPETELAARRIGFYERNGFCLNEYPYSQPPISKGKQAVPLMIMTSGRTVTADEFAQIKQILYTRVYQCE